MEKLPHFESEGTLARHLKTPYALLAYEKLSLGNQVKRFRKKAGMTQANLAKKLGTSQSVIARMESGKQNFTLGTLVSLSIILERKLLVRFA